MMGDFMRFHSDEPLEVMINPRRTEEQDQARAAGAMRLQSLGVRLSGTESSDEIGSILDAVDEFEQAVESRGGDLMVDEGPHGTTREPDDPDFVLPRRGEHESVAAFLGRLSATAERVRHRSRRAL